MRAFENLRSYRKITADYYETVSKNKESKFSETKYFGINCLNIFFSISFFLPQNSKILRRNTTILPQLSLPEYHRQQSDNSENVAVPLISKYYFSRMTNP